MANENKQMSVILKELKRKNNAANKEIDMITLIRTHLNQIFLPTDKCWHKIFPLKGMMTTRIHTGKLFFVFCWPCCCFDLFCFYMKTMRDILWFKTSLLQFALLNNV